jgi:hypothetical protein
MQPLQNPPFCSNAFIPPSSSQSFPLYPISLSLYTFPTFPISPPPPQTFPSFSLIIPNPPFPPTPLPFPLFPQHLRHHLALRLLFSAFFSSISKNQCTPNHTHTELDALNPRSVCSFLQPHNCHHCIRSLILQCNKTQMIDVQYTRALYSLSNRLKLACKIREQTLYSRQ